MRCGENAASMELAFFKGFATGGALIVAIGAQNAFVLRQGLKREHVLAERGLGIVVLSHALAREAVNAGRLVQVLPGWALPPLPVHAVMLSRLQPASVRAFVDFLAARLSLV